MIGNHTRVGNVFVPGKLPEYTYNPRTNRALEQRVLDYLEEAGSILTISGPTKTGKSVLLKQVVNNPIWLEGQGVESTDELYRRVGDALGIYTSFTMTEGSSTQTQADIGGQIGIPIVANMKAGGTHSRANSAGGTRAVERPLAMVLSEYIESSRPLIIDDFHFIQRSVQREIVRALKPAVLAGCPIIFVSISHRAKDVVTAEPDMTGRVTALDVKFWNTEELLVIAEKGFRVLNVSDSREIADKLAEQSYGSPHLMQQFCREVCKSNDIRRPVEIARSLRTPADWTEFFRDQLDTASRDWFNRLLRGPQQKGRTKRTIWTLRDHQLLDGYGLTLKAIASTGPKLDLTKDDIAGAVANLVQPPPPALHQTTRVLQNMSAIAAKRSVRPGEDLEANSDVDDPPANLMDSDPGSAEVQPVLEYIEQGPTSTLHIADPFFAFYLKWGTHSHLEGWRPPTGPGTEQNLALFDDSSETDA